MGDEWHEEGMPGGGWVELGSDGGEEGMGNGDDVAVMATDDDVAVRASGDGAVRATLSKVKAKAIG